MYLGDFNPSDIFDFHFTTTQFSTGAPFTLAGSPAIRVYKSNSNAESSAGLTLDVDFDSRTGFNHVRVDTSADGTFYAAGGNFTVMLSAGTVDSVSVVGCVLRHFSIQARSPLRPTTAGRTLTVSSGGVADANLAQILGTAVTEGAAGRLAAALTAFLNVASPVLTVASVNQGGDSFARLGAPAGASVSADIAQIEGQVALITPSALAGAVWDESRASHTGAGSFGQGVSSVQGNVTGSVASVTAGVTVSTMSDKTGYTLSAAGIQAVWDRDSSFMTVVGSMGKLFVDTLNATISSRLATSGYTAPDNTDIAAIKAKTDNLPASPAAVGNIPTANQNADALLDRADAIETGWTLRQTLRIVSAVCAGIAAGMATTTGTFRNLINTKTRVTATIDTNGNRSAVTLDGS